LDELWKPILAGMFISSYRGFWRGYFRYVLIIVWKKREI